MARGRGTPTGVLRVSGAVAASLLGDSVLYAVLPARFALFGVTPGLVGVLLSVNRFIRLASNPLAAWVYLRLGFTASFLLALLLGAATTAAYGLFPSFWLLLLARVLWGVCYSFLRLGGYLVVLEESPANARGRLMGFFYGGQRLGSLVAVLVGGFLFDLVGRQGSFLALAALTLSGAALVAGIPTVGKATALPTVAPADPHPPPRPVRDRVWWFLISWVPEFTRPQRYRFLAVSALQFAIFFTVSGLLVSTLGYLLGQRVGEGVQWGGVFLGLATFTGLLLALRWASDLMAPYLGSLSDRFGRGRVVAASLPLLAGSLLAVGLSLHLGAVLASLPFFFWAATTATTALDALAGDLLPPHRRLQALGRYSTWADLGSATGPLAGYAAVAAVDLSWAYLTAAALLLVGAAFFAYAFSLRQPSVKATPSPPEGPPLESDGGLSPAE